MKLSLYGNMPIMTSRDPQVPMEAANKNYVDNAFITHSSNVSLHLTTAQNTLLDSLTVSATELNYLTGTTSSVQTQLNGKVAKAGDTMTGYLTLSANPTNTLHAATKGYVDTQDALKVSKTGDTLTGYLMLHADPTSTMHPATKQYVDSGLSTHAGNAALHLTSTQNTFLDGITVGFAEVNYLTGVTSAVQTQLNSKLNLSGGTLTGALTLSGDPTVALHAATKQYSDAQDALKVAKAGDTMTGALTLSGNPTVALHAAPKQYVDSAVSTHASDAALHLTSAQNTFLDAVTVTAAEVNYLSGVTSGVQAQLNTKFASAGGTITGDVTLAAGKGIFVPKAPTAANELVNKAYVDALVQGKEWKDPITDINLVADNLSAPPATPVVGDVYIIGAAPTGAWTGKAGFAAYHDGTAWVFLQARAVQAGDRFGVDLTSATTVSATLTAHVGKLVTIVSATPGAITYTADTQTPGATTLVFDPQSSKFGVSYTLTDELTWVPTNTSVNLTAGDGLTLAGNTLNFNYGAGLALSSDIIAVAPDTASGLGFDGTNKVTIKRDGTSLTASATGIRVAQTVLDDIANRVAKTGTSSVTGDVTFASTGTLKLDFTPTSANQAVNKGYVDAADTALQDQITTINGTVTTLNADPVTKTYVNTQDALKVAKAGDTMSGFLTLHANPTAVLHAATKQYVDSTVSTHASDAALHLTVGQNAFLDAVTATATEVNRLVGVTGSVQTQIDSKVAKAGDTMTGLLTLSGDPTAAMHAATKQYSDAQDALKVAKAGDTMTGALTLSGDPTVALHAATKGYVDTNLSSHAINAALHLTAAQNTFLDAVTVTSTEVNYLTGVTSAVQTQLNSKLNLSGGTMTGFITLHAAPTAATHAATKGYVDTQDALKVAKAGDTMTGFLTLSADPTALLHAATKQYVDTAKTAANTYTDTQTALKVSKAGDTMTGALTLPADPTANLHAATKQYVDTAKTTTISYVDTADTALQGQITTLNGTVTTLNADPVTKTYVNTQDALKVAKAGDTMTGYLTLHANPTNNMHAVTKQYVDSVAQGLSAKPAVRVATIGNLAATYVNGTAGVGASLTGSVNGALVVDGVTVVTGDRILVKDQTNKLQNGDYTVQQTGTVSTPFILVRNTTVDQSNEVPGSFFYVFDGTLKGTGWTFTVDNPTTFTIGTNNIYVNQFSGQGSLVGGAGMILTGNTFNVQTANSSRIVVNADSIDLATTTVTPGTYTKLTVDGYGRATAGTNPNTLAGYGITDGQPLNANLTSLSSVATSGILVRDNTNTMVAKAIVTSGTGISVTNGSGGVSGDITISSNATAAATASTLVARDASGNFAANVITASLTGNASTATKLQTARTFAATGDVTAGAVSFDGSANVSLTTTLSNTGVVAGSYTKVTVDAKGRVTSGSNPTTLAGYGITDAYTKTETDALIAALRQEIAELHMYILSRI